MDILGEDPQDPVAVRLRCPKYRVRECCLTMYRTSELAFRSPRGMPRRRGRMPAHGTLLAGFSGSRLGDVNGRRESTCVDEIAAEGKQSRHPAEDVESYVHGHRRKWLSPKDFGRAKGREFCALPRGRAYWQQFDAKKPRFSAEIWILTPRQLPFWTLPRVAHRVQPAGGPEVRRAGALQRLSTERLRRRMRASPPSAGAPRPCRVGTRSCRAGRSNWPR
jgi:hypothetical protein